MDVIFLHHEQYFVWDADKANKNLAKHGVSFEQASTVFFDPFAVLVDATSNDDQREAIIGLTEEMDALYVVHILRQDDVIRIISARPATRQERSEHEFV
ncbi:MAG TPA: BrnT family toxin [Edaphobacter sp.]|nr:BrnT family toxin [Edaphobacter sp.]